MVLVDADAPNWRKIERNRSATSVLKRVCNAILSLCIALVQP